ncbi:MAG: tRNA (guanosine(46)-N7)-methyltransferase TrmB [Pseudomonadota bacterium]
MKQAPGPNPLFDAEPGVRKVRSFVLREGRLTPAQQRALGELWPRFGIDNAHTPIDLAATFGRDAPVIVEIGFGSGDTLAHMAREAPETNFVGIEVHRPGIGHLLNLLQEQSIDNVRVICADAVQVLTERIADSELAGLRLYFPDPWPKKRHHKRRIVQPPWVDLVARRLRPGGVLHMATDWIPYAEHMLEVASAEPLLENIASDGTWVDRPSWRPETRFEHRGEALGHGVRDLMFRRTDPAALR